ncbi:hypothetical protein F2P81_001519 [Scophthalmus maximus]|uniref:Uncharacterized protein n=1 Tax=Scophthalmus maximus TaxID=52904 RepID=A0A6A4TN20_SCOMX|nr:hypothetical protein F2P81_001519 [Scophthalmus maximus]
MWAAPDDDGERYCFFQSERTSAFQQRGYWQGYAIMNPDQAPARNHVSYILRLQMTDEFFCNNNNNNNGNVTGLTAAFVRS